VPVKGGGGVGGPRKKPKGSVGAAISGAGRKPAPKPKPKPKPSVGQAIQSAGKPLAQPRPKPKQKPKRSVGKAIEQAGRPTGPRKTGKAISRAGRPLGSAAEKQALYTALAQMAASTKAAKAQGPRPSTASSVGRALGMGILGNAPTGASTRSPGETRDAARKATPGALRRARKAVHEELEGRGDAVKYSRRLGKYATEKGLGVQTGGGPAGALAKRSKKGTAPRLLAARPYRVKDAPKLLRKGLEDFINFPATAIPSGYVPVHAGVQAARGNTKPAEEYWKGVQESDAVYAAGEAGVKFVKGDTKGAKKSLARARDLASEHPGFTAMEVYGLGRGLDRGAGAGVRATGRATVAAGRTVRSERVKNKGREIYAKADPHTRPDATQPGTRMRHLRTYDRGLVGKKVGVVRDRKGAERAARLRKEADRAERVGNDERARDLRKEAASGGRTLGVLRDPKRMTESEIKRYINLQQAAGESRRVRIVSDRRRKAEDVVGVSEANAKVRNATAKAQRKPQTARPEIDDGAALSLIAQNITRATPDDLRAYRVELEAAFEKLTDPDKRMANRKTRELIDRSLEAERNNPGVLKRNAERAREYSREVDIPVDRMLEDVELLDPDQATRVKAESYAARRLGAKRDEEQGRWVQPVKLSEKDRAARAKELEGMAAGAERAASQQKASGKFKFGDANETRLRRLATEARSEAKRLRDGESVDWEPLDYEAVARQMADEPDAVPSSYVSQAPNATSAGAYFRSSEKEPTLGKKPRTEKATLEGTFDASHEPMIARATKGANLYAATKNYRDGVRDGGFRVNGKVEWNDRATAEQIAKRATQETGDEHVIVRAKPWGISRKQFEAMLDDIDDMQDARAFDGFREDILKGLNGQGDGPYVVVPKVWRDHQVAHTDVLGTSDAGKLWQAFRANFSKAVLSTSPSPTVGSAVEGYMFRMPIRRAGPVSITTYHRMVKRLRDIDPDAADLLEDMTIGARGGSSGALTINTNSRHFNPGQLKGGGWRTTTGAFNALIHHTPPGKVASGAYRLWTSFIFDLLNNTLIERPVQKALLGKELRQSGLMDADLLNLSGKAMDQLAEGVRDIPTMVKLSNGLRDSYGQYRAYGPNGRKLITNAMPFLAWWLSSANFVARVLPRDHPALLALTAQAAMVTDDLEREQARWEGAKWMRGTLDVGGVRWQASRNTPLGAFTDPTGTLGGLAIPQIHSIILALGGKDWKGQDLKHEDGRRYDALDIGAYVIGQLLRSSTGLALPIQAVHYAKKPGSLINAVRISPQEGGGRYEETPKVKQRTVEQATPRRRNPEIEAAKREARALADAERPSRSEIEALKREARALQGVK
jgi:hypothetical protein